MLYKNKLKKSKIYLYSALISVMFIGTLFFVYKNYQLISGQSYTEKNEKLQKASEELKQKVAGKNLDSIKRNLIDMQVLKKSIYQNLIINTEEIPVIKAGKEDPFKSYE